MNFNEKMAVLDGLPNVRRAWMNCEDGYISVYGNEGPYKWHLIPDYSDLNLLMPLAFKYEAHTEILTVYSDFEMEYVGSYEEYIKEIKQYLETVYDNQQGGQDNG